jgi:4-alpha-glucanotransferase
MDDAIKVGQSPRSTEDRQAGILAHPTSLPGRFGVGDLGPAAHRFLDWIADAGQRLWQVLPLSVPDKENSPYGSLSVFAGNPLLISPELLAADGLLTVDELNDASAFREEDQTVDFPAVLRWKRRLLDRASQRFFRLSTSHPLRQAMEAAEQDSANWLSEHALFMAIREANGKRPWREWDQFVDADRRPTADAVEALADRAEVFKFLQFLFVKQWSDLRNHARSRGIRIIGDVPIYVSEESVDVWAHRELFQLDETGAPTRVAGVPPDYFSAAGQLWNNPVYDWDLHRQTGYRWWIDRIRNVLETVDLVRLDHFRGYESYWCVPVGEETAVNGHWVDGPRDAFFDAIRRGIRDASRLDPNDAPLPFVAEDLGLITEEVTALRKRFELPGTVVMQFNLEDLSNHDPLDIDPRSVAYTGTHDNDTTVGWFAAKTAEAPAFLEHFRQFLPCDPKEIAWELIDLAWRSPAQMAIAPLQDVLSLGTDARMNVPGTDISQRANWAWRCPGGLLTDEIQQRLKDVTQRHER